MAPTPKVYVPGENLDLDKLVKTYESIADNASLAPQAAEERDPKDAFGLRTPPKDKVHTARLTAERLNNFLALLIDQDRLTPEQVTYAVELFALCVFNQDPPRLSRADSDAVRRKAFEYWQQATSTPRDAG